MNKPYSDSTLERKTKKELIEMLRCAEYNERVAKETLEQHIKNVEKWAPMVKCKDCTWRDDELACLNPNCTKSYYGCYVKDEHYCSYGERREKND